ncbi:MAG TPA: hypothetical protein VL463_11280 [Kofleriaceae bacterium]|jgi:hypothetical protein|nr:hypothetical protein [Kofleriaceae bacterium]
MPVIARDAVASDQLVYAYPYPIDGQAEVSCGSDEVVVMCPAWQVGDMLQPGRHAWRTPQPGKPTGAYFVLTAPVEAPFDMATAFVLPTTGQQVRVRAAGSLLVRCADPALLVAQFVGLPFERINDGVIHSVSQSIARLLGRVLARRVVLSGTPLAVTDPSMLNSIGEELIAYNPTGGAVFGVEFVRFNHLAITAEDASGNDWSAQGSWPGAHAMAAQQAVQAMHAPSQPVPQQPQPPMTHASGEFASRDSQPAMGQVVSGGLSSASVSGEIAPRSTTMPPPSADIPMMQTGTRVLVAGPDGRLHAAIVRQHMAGYYELEIGQSGETVWVPMAQVLPET